MIKTVFRLSHSTQNCKLKTEALNVVREQRMVEVAFNSFLIGNW